MQSMHFPSSHTHAHTFVLLDLTFVQIIMQQLYGRNLNQNLTSLTNILALLVVKKRKKRRRSSFPHRDRPNVPRSKLSDFYSYSCGEIRSSLRSINMTTTPHAQARTRTLYRSHSSRPECVFADCTIQESCQWQFQKIICGATE